MVICEKKIIINIILSVLLILAVITPGYAELNFKNFESKKVSYLNAISFAKAIIVTSDSVSMVTEACSTGKPTYIIDIPTKSKRFSLFIKNLIHLKLAYYLKDSISLKGKKKTLNDIDKVVEKIKKRIEI